MQGLNEVRLLGCLGQDVKFSVSQGGMEIAKMSVAVGESRKDKDTGQWKEFTEWVNVTAFGSQAKNCNDFLRKGSKVMVMGKFRTNKWEKDGQTHYSSEVAADRVIFLDSKADGQGQQQRQQPPAQSQQRRPPMNDDLGPAFPSEASGMDDVPF